MDLVCPHLAHVAIARSERASVRQKSWLDTACSREMRTRLSPRPLSGVAAQNFVGLTSRTGLERACKISRRRRCMCYGPSDNRPMCARRLWDDAVTGPGGGARSDQVCRKPGVVASACLRRQCRLEAHLVSKRRVALTGCWRQSGTRKREPCTRPRSVHSRQRLGS